MAAARFIQTHSALDEVAQHVKDTGAEGSRIEAFLAQYVLVLLCAEMQQEINSLVKSRMKAGLSEDLSGFVASSSGKLLRSIGTGEIAGFLGNFSAACKQEFQNFLDDKVVLQYNAAVKDRHSVAHSSGVQLTLIDVANALTNAEAVLSAVDAALGRVVLSKS